MLGENRWSVLFLIHFLITRQNRKRLRAIVSVEELTILARNVRFSCLDIARDTETRPVPNVDEAAFDDRVRQPVDNLIPPLRLAHRILEADVVLRQDGRHGPPLRSYMRSGVRAPSRTWSQCDRPR